jgi:hypothetical protein
MNRQRCKLLEGVIEGSQEGAVSAREKNPIILNPKNTHYCGHYSGFKP